MHEWEKDALIWCLAATVLLFLVYPPRCTIEVQRQYEFSVPPSRT